MEQILMNLIEKTRYELFHYPETTKMQDVKYIIKRLLKPKDTPKKDRFFWTHGLLTQALENVGDVESLKEYYDQWIEKGLPVHNIDNIMNGYSLLYVYEKTREEKYRQAMDKLYEYVCNYMKETGNPIPYRRNHPTHVYVDGLGMVVPFLCRYGATFRKKEAQELGIKQVTEFLKYGMEEKSGLPYHGYDTRSYVKQGIIGWGRAVGWLLLSMADSLEYLQEGKEKEEILIAFENLIKATERFQRKDGYFSWQLTAMEGPKDTSATAMIGYAIKKGEKLLYRENKEEKTKTEAVLAEIEKALRGSYRDGNIYDCSGECEGFGRYPQIYGAYPWSLGPAVRFLVPEKLG